MIKSLIKKLISLLYHCYYYSFTYLTELKSMRIKKPLWKDIHISKTEEKDIRTFYKVSGKWHRLYKSYTGIFNKYYFPEILFSTKLEPLLCPRNICSVLQDKGMADILYGSVPGLRLPKTIAVNCSGIFYDGDRNIIDEEKAAALVEEWGLKNRYVMKPTIGTHSGTGVYISGSREELSHEELRAKIRSYGENFIIQECVVNCEELGKIYSGSLNTVRIMTYILNDRLFHTPPILRIGHGGSAVDNVGLGGLFIGVKEDGSLNREAYLEFGGSFTHHPDSGVCFEGYHIPNMKQLIDMAYACHGRTPHTKFISWDFAVDENYCPVLIEANMLGHTSWFPQAASGESIFGSNTESMLELIRIR